MCGYLEKIAATHVWKAVVCIEQLRRQKEREEIIILNENFGWNRSICMWCVSALLIINRKFGWYRNWSKPADEAVWWWKRSFGCQLQHNLYLSSPRCQIEDHRNRKKQQQQEKEKVRKPTKKWAFWIFKLPHQVMSDKICHRSRRLWIRNEYVLPGRKFFKVKSIDDSCVFFCVWLCRFSPQRWTSHQSRNPKVRVKHW